MGVRKWDFIQWELADLDEIRPRVMAIDTPNYITRLTQSYVYHQKRRDAERIPTQHVWAVLGIIRQALRHGFTPVFVFDGPPEALKRPPNPELVSSATELYRKFREHNDIYNSRLAEALNDSKAMQWYFAVNHLKDLFKAIGIPSFTAPSEAEMAAAVMVSDATAGTVVTNDIDALLFGAPHVTRAVKFAKKQIERVYLNDVAAGLKTDLTRLRDLAILCGCDFYPSGIKGIGPRKGLALLNQHGNLERVLKARGLPPNERATILDARAVFDEPMFLQLDGIPSSINPPLVSRVSELLRPVMGKERAKKTTEELVKLWKEFGREQVTLERWT